MPEKPKIFLTRELPPETMEILQANSELTMNREDRYLTKEEIISGIKGKDGLLCLLTDEIDDEILAANPSLKVVANFAVGFNNVDVEAATRRGVPVTNTPGVLTDTTADMAFALLMDAARRVAEGDRFVRTKAWDGWGPLQFLGADITGATLGLIGLGRIGRAMVPRAQGFGMDVVYWNRTRLKVEEEERLGIRHGDFEDVLQEADFLSLHVALNSETEHLIGAREFSLMKSTACIVNTARGPVIDEKALVQALKSGTIASAGLDVYEQEPILEPELYTLENAVLAPHLGSGTIGTRTKMGNMAAENCLAACRGERPPNLVNPKIYA
ncbi:MAG: 2-hydroxyacid dehydrogenase [Rubripirellula sp.]